jgi:hypothetical protein
MSDANVSAMTKRILNENSYGYLGQHQYQKGNKPGKPTGPTITWDSLANEDLAIASVIVNLSNTPYSGFNTIASAAYQNGTFANEKRIYTDSVLNGDPNSNDCRDIIQAMNAAVSVLTNGSQLPLYYNQWASVLQGGMVISPTRNQFQIDDTIFFHL